MNNFDYHLIFSIDDFTKRDYRREQDILRYLNEFQVIFEKDSSSFFKLHPSGIDSEYRDFSPLVEIFQKFRESMNFDYERGNLVESILEYDIDKTLTVGQELLHFDHPAIEDSINQYISSLSNSIKHYAIILGYWNYEKGSINFYKK